MRERCSTGLGLVLAGVGVVCCARAAAAASVVIAQPSACGSTDELVHGIERSVGSPLSNAAPLHFDLSIEREGRDVVARLVIESELATPRVRQLDAPDCATLIETVAVAVALALGDAEESASERAASPVVRGMDAEPDRDVSPPGASGVARASLEPSLSVWLLGDVGSLPAPSLGAALAADVRWAWLDVVVLGSWIFDRDIELGSPSAPAAGASLGLASGGVLACARSEDAVSQFSARGCAGAEVGWLRGVGTGISDPSSGGSVWLAPRLDVTGFLAIPDTPLRLGAWLTAAVPVNRDELTIDGVGRAHRPPAIVGRGAIGAELRFE